MTYFLPAIFSTVHYYSISILFKSFFFSSFIYYFINFTNYFFISIFHFCK